jgi:hypothetical protein
MTISTGPPDKAESLDYDAIEVEGAARTTGAGPGRTPGVLTAGLIAIKVPRVDNLAMLAEKLRDAGVHVQKQANYTVDIRALREALQLSREQFAIRYNLSVESGLRIARRLIICGRSNLTPKARPNRNSRTSWMYHRQNRNR